MRILLMAVVLLAGCASVTPPDQLRDQVGQLAVPRTGTAVADASVAELLARQPLAADTAVRIAISNNPALEASLAALAITDAERAQASQWPSPHLALARLREGSTLEIERMLTFNVLQLFTLPWRADAAQRQLTIARVQAAQEVIRIAAETRKAWTQAVAAAQTASYLRDARDAADAGAELARRMARTGNWSRLQQAREQATLADITAQLARAEQAAVASREKLTRLLGLWGEQAGYQLPDRLPDLPPALTDAGDIEATALRERLDVRAARDEVAARQASLGLARATGPFDDVTLGLVRNTTFDDAAGTRSTKRGVEIDLPLPLPGVYSARTAMADAQARQAQARLRETAVRARSEAREAWHGWRTAYDLARHYRDEVVPLRKLISDETVLRYNGMLASVWDLLAEVRNHATAVTAAIEAQRDFWLADTDLRTALTGTSPGAWAAGRTTAPALAAEPQGH